MNTTPIIKIAGIVKTGEWVSVKARVVQTYEPRTDSIAQAGLLADETGQIGFIAWRKSGLRPLEKDSSYLITNAVVDSWKGELRLSLNRSTTISKTDEYIEPTGAGLVGTIKAIIPESGLILRCPKCKRVLVDEEVCMIHGQVEASPDLRVKASFISDKSQETILLNCDVVEKLLGITLEEAKRLGAYATDMLVEGNLVGKRFRIGGHKLGGYLIVYNVERLE